ncbi:MAG: enoyl-CoA hydratase/isomerase family protein [Opitutales bacterium]
MKTSIQLEINEGVASLLLCPPEGKPPTLDGEVLAELEHAVVQAKSANPRVLVVKSQSAKFFCVGANINVLKETTEKTIVPWVMEGHRILNMLEDLPFPVLAVVEGYAMGGGLELAMACDIIYASESAKIAQSEAGLGFIPGWGGTRRLAQRVGVGQAKKIFYTGEMLDAQKACNLGLVDAVYTSEQMAEEVEGFCNSVLKNNANAISQFKTILEAGERAARNANATEEAFRSVTCLQDPDAKKRLEDFLNKKRSK